MKRAEKRGMTCMVADAETPCGRVAMYHAGELGFCFRHKEQAIAATIKVKERHVSKRSVEEYISGREAWSIGQF